MKVCANISGTNSEWCDPRSCREQDDGGGRESGVWHQGRSEEQIAATPPTPALCQPPATTHAHLYHTPALAAPPGISTARMTGQCRLYPRDPHDRGARAHAAYPGKRSHSAPTCLVSTQPRIHSAPTCLVSTRPIQASSARGHMLMYKDLRHAAPPRRAHVPQHMLFYHTGV